MDNNNGLSLILPCFNEALHIRQSVPKIFAVLESMSAGKEIEVIFVDDHSTDETAAFLKTLSASYPKMQIQLLLLPQNLGRGGAVKEGLKKTRYRHMGFMDIDCEISENNLPQFMAAVFSGIDLVIARRSFAIYLSPRYLIRRMVTLSYRLISGVLVPHKTFDTSAGMKFFSKKSAQLILVKSQFNNWFWDTEICILCERENLRIQEIPVSYDWNAKKPSTVSLRKDVPEYLRSLWKFRKSNR